MRRILLLGVVGLLMLLVAVPAGAATTGVFSADFREYFGKSPAHPCTNAFTCGVGTVAGFGAATSAFQIVDFGGYDPATGCGPTTAQRTISLTDGSGTLVLTGTGTVCFPGRSFETPGASSGHSYGNPALLELAWTVTGGTGVFAGASGRGTESFRNAGDSGIATLRGTLTLP